MTTHASHYGRLALWAICACLIPRSWALDPHKTLTQYSRHVWGQQDGLPQDTIKSITQTPDGYLWLGTDEGLARFDGFEFTVFSRPGSDLPANSITALAASPDGSLWIGTSNGLGLYRDGHFRTFTVKDGLPDDDIRDLYSDHAGTLWMVSGVDVCRFQDGKFTILKSGVDLPITAARVVRENARHELVVAGSNLPDAPGHASLRVVSVAAGKVGMLVDDERFAKDVIQTVLSDSHGNLWIGGTLGLIERTASGELRRFDSQSGLPEDLVRSVVEDRDGNLWVGTNSGIARLEGGRFAVPATGNDNQVVRALFEDREADLWVGGNDGLTRLRDDVFTTYGKAEGLPSDEPNTVFQDHSGRIWVGFHDAGLMLFAPGQPRLFSRREGMPDTEIFSIREAPGGDLLMGTRAGLVRMHGSTFTLREPPDPQHSVVWDALETSDGRLWMATPSGLLEQTANGTRTVAGGGPLIVNAVVTLCQGRDGVLWAGSYGRGLWRVKGEERRLFGIKDGLSSENVREIYEDSDGILWVGTFGGGLNALRNGKFYNFTQKDGLLSDNIANIVDDGQSLWLATTRGICRIAKSQLWQLAGGKRKRLEPVNYGMDDGLRSAQCSPGYPTAGGDRTADGRLWFTTSRGLAVYDPHAKRPVPLPPQVQISEITTDGHAIDLSHTAYLSPGVERIRVRYTAIHLSAPEQVSYSYRLDGMEANWVPAGDRREINYNTPKHGNYRFMVKAELPGGPSTETSYAFDVLPHYYETAWFRALVAAGLLGMAWAIYQLRLRQIRSRFSLVLEERARLAREIHDTLAQGFVGISSQLDAVAMCMPDEQSSARKYLDMARRMARHSLTEARRSVMDLRASVLEGQDLAAALESGTRMWTAGAGVDVKVDVSGPEMVLPQEMEQHLLRIAQEAVTNVVKHAGANRIAIKLHTEARKLFLQIRDNGRGFDTPDVFSSRGGHFGLIGMRERAERLGGELHLASNPGEGTEVEVTVPLP
ncbi:MAG TPA: two-component regulator propeller domain-containing protein [Bryobacteraceae bacterium]|nr:two-component regulator propeller domain-containing protein [Bryobacteraceae bacterium]